MRREIATSASGIELYHLYKDDKKILTVRFNSVSNSARVSCNNEKRVFLIGKESTRRPKTVLLNEYGVKIGELGQEDNEYFIDVNKERFYYAIHNNPIAELVLYKESKDKPLVVCGLKTNDGNTSVEFKKEQSFPASSHPSLLMAICWYMFLPVVKENIVEYA
jgi:hypothetical protein